MNNTKTTKILITVKTSPVPSSKYDELVRTAGVTEDGQFVRLYPINFRDLPYAEQYKKYQWVELEIEKHTSDPRPESYRPVPDKIILGEKVDTDKATWSRRKEIILPLLSESIEVLKEQQSEYNTSLGFIKPAEISGMKIVKDNPDWPKRTLNRLNQGRLWETRDKTRLPPRKLPFKFKYQFRCEDSRCPGHTMVTKDWEVDTLFWRNVDNGLSHEEAAEAVRKRFFDEICSDQKDTYFYVGTTTPYWSWIVLGCFYPKIKKSPSSKQQPLRLC